MPSFPAVLNFRRKVHESTIDEFASLDKLQFEIAKARIRSKLINDLPSLNHFTSGVDEISILKRELGKQRRIMPIRKLFKEIPNLLLTLKPCLMMSPLSVSLFLEAESYMFDTIIFDEASQVCTENAIGAISRGKQVIIAGDSKQLPPTNFFNATTSDSDFDLDIDDELYDDVSAYESILDESGLLPERTLIWHYRSRHEHLIAFSNSKIYKNSLITFPSNIEKMANNGVEYVHVKDGFYDRGGKNGNVNEANKIAELVFDHFKTHPERSLGVVAFGEVQQQAINCVIRQMRMQNQQFEPFFSDNLAEPFFIKNLENVQGDERDTIIFSIGYAKDSSGKMHMFFGPLSSPGGERRLNVAITRAKYNVKLVGSIVPTDIEIEKISSEGPKLLRSYIDYAINGIDVLKSDITESDIIEHDSPFEEAVFNYLDRKGYKVCTQVGCSGYRIDMAVKHPKISGKYVIGIECDGAAYHSARTARERDRLRQSLLESMGWKIYRIWSTDWIKDPITEGQKLIEAIENAISEDSDESTENICTIENHQVEDFLKLDTKEVSLEMSSNPYGFLAYNETDLSSVFRDRDDVTYVINCIYAIVINEYPVHYELLCQKLAGIFGNEKATVKVRNYINFVLPKMNAKVTRKGDFLYPKDFTSVPVRTPNTRKINHIDTEELAEAMLIISGNCYGTTREALCAETCRAYGFNRSGQNITTALNKAYEMLIKSGKAKEVDGKVVASQF
jgi:very-short-patch-repair endonuclease